MNSLSDKKIAGVCGICCSTCSLYIGSKEDLSRLDFIAKKMNVTVDSLKCEGCRSETKSIFCKTCRFVPCSIEKGIDFCFECKEYPCKELYSFQKEKPHRIELWDHNEFLEKNGLEKWITEIEGHHTCNQCGTINSAYDIKCRKCNNIPGSDYIALHKEAIISHLQR